MRRSLSVHGRPACASATRASRTNHCGRARHSSGLKSMSSVCSKIWRGGGSEACARPSTINDLMAGADGDSGKRGGGRAGCTYVKNYIMSNPGAHRPCVRTMPAWSDMPAGRDFASQGWCMQLRHSQWEGRVSCPTRPLFVVRQDGPFHFHRLPYHPFISDAKRKRALA